ncbi:MAG: hypothetical protein EU539_05040 [Promethearchaeota archaeon]|nr:MAG: hypothetical protein EU539_05040 [Candidatus Lokiarchaeota archaeon]
MHFLRKLIENPILEAPVHDNMDVHRHYYRYSRGEFIGPALVTKKTSSRISLKGSHEYEDLIQELVIKTANEDEIEVKGVLISGKDLTEELLALDLNWDLKKSTGKTKNYKANFSDKIDKEKLLKIIDIFRKHSYLLLSFKLNPTCKISTKKRIPQPSKKKVEDDDINSRVQFCNGVMDNTDKNTKLLIEKAFKDFESEIPNEWSNITLTNNYKFSEIILPKDEKDSLMLRIKAKRKGKLIRTLDVDGVSIEKQYAIIV